ncbi:MAG: O-antigen ligase family protein [Acidimicrobiia bacterium]
MDAFTLILLGSAIPLGGFVFSRFARWEREGRRHLVLGVFLAVVVVEALLAGSTDSVPTSIFRPSVAGQDIRLPDPLLALALLARAWVSPVPRVLRGVWAVMGVFVVWLLYCTFIGLDNGSAFADTLFDLKSYLYIVGTMVLVAGVPIQDILRRRRFERWILTISLVSTVFMVMDLVGAATVVPIPGAPIVLGRVGSETHTVLVALGILAFGIEACSRRPRVIVVVAAFLLLATPFGGAQRASFVQLGLTVLVMAPFMLTATWVRRVRFSPTDALVFLFAFVIAGGLILGLSGELATVSDRVQDTFGGQVESATASVRVSIIETSTKRIAERPLFGWGMGDRVSQRFSGILGLGQTEQVTSHNVAVDLALRTGLVGAVLGFIAILGPVVSGWRVWLSGVDDRVAAASLAAIAAVAGILGKGMVETIFEKFRIGIALGFLLGLLLAAARSLREPAAAGERVPAGVAGAGWDGPLGPIGPANGPR